MSRRDPYLAFCFRVNITNAGLTDATGLFKSVGGLSFETEVVDFKEGGVNDMTHKLVGGTKFKNIVLKRGFSGNEFANWWKQWQAPSAKPQRVSGTIEQLDTQGTVKAIWESLDKPYRAAMDQGLIYTRLGNPIAKAELAERPVPKTPPRIR